MRDMEEAGSTAKRKDRARAHALAVPAAVLMAIFVFSFFSIASAAGQKKIVPRAALAQGFAIGSGDPALSLQVGLMDGKVAFVAPAATGQGNVNAVRSGGEGQVMLNLATTLDVTLKFDLYVSSDGENFEYASTCAVSPGISGFEMWQRPVREFALGNPRVIAEGKMPCD